MTKLFSEIGLKKNWKEKENEAGSRMDRKEEQQLKLNRNKIIKYEKETEKMRMKISI